MQKSIIFFDSECVMCSRFASIVFRFDKNKEIYFSSINSDLYKSLFVKLSVNIPNETVVFYKSPDEIYYKSKAVFEIIRQLQFPFNCLMVFNFLPNSLLDMLYQFVASRRKKLFGKSDQKCKIIQSGFSERILK